MTINVFIVGATGYQGSTVLTQLLSPEHEFRCQVTALGPTDEAADWLKSKGAEPLTGSPDDLDTLKKGASDADVVFSLDIADRLDSVKALVEGLRPKGKKGILIHGSSTTILADDSRSSHASDTVYSDAQPEIVLKLPSDHPSQGVNDWILRHAAQHVTAVVVCAPLIYGEAGGPKQLSQQIPMLTRAMYKTKRVATVGKGEGIWNFVHVQDLADLYILLMNSALTPCSSGPPAEGLYFAESGEFAWKDLMNAIGSELIARGALRQTGDLGVFTVEEMAEHLLGDGTWELFGCNARCVAQRARERGWAPVRAPLLDTMHDEVRRVMEAGKLH